ncbi:MAG: 2,3-bisphosphoglycerate-independent phosphoglycerate mutase [Schleiferiaceae bacterium]|nr:2,3-bisphosphoglycerate-independent phosphoglycerate mutase [Schleiferiaceae bacterium]
MSNKTVLMVLDGWGIAKDPNVSAVDKANTPFIDSLYQKYPNTQIRTSGRDVGLPAGQMGNSEVGHMNLGAGRVVYQDLVKINMAVEDGSIEQNETLIKAFDHAKANNKKVHLIGLISDGGVHSHILHAKGLLSMANNKGVSNVFVHAFTDGRDTDPNGGLAYLADLENHMAQTTGRVATIVGRYYAMDRDKRWERVKLAYDALVHNTGDRFNTSKEAIENSYANNVTDEFIKPAIIAEGGKIEEGDVVISFNFRTDRGREITMALTQEAFREYNMHPLNLHYVTMTMYDETFKNVNIVYRKENLSNTMGEVLANARKSQIRIAETEKYPHVTFFFSGGREEPFEGESRLLCPSPKVATYDLQPEMSAGDIRDKIVPELEKGEVDFVCLNFANPDMVGHTGDFDAAIKACETVDSCTKSVVEAGLKSDYTFIILADHGNCDKMINEDGSPNTAHTTHPVPCFLVGNNLDGLNIKEGKLGDIAPTLLDYMGVEIPAEMTGESLLVK